MRELVGVWWRRRAVRVALALALIAILVGLVLAAAQLRGEPSRSTAAEGPADLAGGRCVSPEGDVSCLDVGEDVEVAQGRRNEREPVRARDLGVGRRVLQAPLVLLAVAAAGVSAAAASSDAREGLLGLAAASARSPGRGVAQHAWAGAVGAMGWFALVAVVLVVGGHALVAGWGEGAVVDGGALGALAAVVARLALSVAVLATLAHGLAAVLGGGSTPVAVVLVGPLVLEAVALVASGGSIGLLPGGGWVLVARGTGAAGDLGVSTAVATWLPVALAALALGAGALLSAAALRLGRAR